MEREKRPAPSGRRPSGGGPRGRRGYGRPFPYKKKICRFCADKALHIDYKEIGLLRNFVTESGKLLSRHATGCCARHQRIVTRAVKLARIMALLPFKE